MSGTVTPAVPETPAVQATPIAATPAPIAPVAGASPEPAAGTQPPGTVATEVTSPAALSSPGERTSLLSEAQSEGAPATAPPGGEADAAAAAAPAEPLPLPSFEPFVIPEGVSLDAERQTQFTNALAEIESRAIANPTELHKALQEAGQKMLDLYIEEGKTLETTIRSQLEPAIKDETTKANAQVWYDLRDGWVKETQDDPELGRGDKHQMEEIAMQAGRVLDLYGSEVGADRVGSLREALALTGAGDHPELWRFVKWVASRSLENSRMLAAPTFVKKMPMSRAERLYQHSIPPNGAA